MAFRAVALLDVSVLENRIITLQHFCSRSSYLYFSHYMKNAFSQRPLIFLLGSRTAIIDHRNGINPSEPGLAKIRRETIGVSKY